MGTKQMLKNPNYDEILLNAISGLRYHKSIAGSEGVAYFITDDLVVKEYNQCDDWDAFDAVFFKYCQEMQMFSQKGFAVPKIYSFMKVPNIEHYTKKQKNKYKYYILEEQIKGREMYVGYVDDAYDLVKDICSSEEFKSVVAGLNNSSLDESVAVADEILKRYFEDYVLMNEMLEAMSDAQLRTFVSNAHQMFVGGEVSYPDLFPSNIFANDGKLTLLDSHINYYNQSELDDAGFIADLVNLFLFNYFVNASENGIVNEKLNKNTDLIKLSRKNNVLTREVMSKMLRLLKTEKSDVFSTLDNRKKGQIKNSLETIFKSSEDVDVVFEQFEK